MMLRILRSSCCLFAFAFLCSVSLLAAAQNASDSDPDTTAISSGLIGFPFASGSSSPTPSAGPDFTSLSSSTSESASTADPSESESLEASRPTSLFTSTVNHSATAVPRPSSNFTFISVSASGATGIPVYAAYGPPSLSTGAVIATAVGSSLAVGILLAAAAALFFTYRRRSPQRLQRSSSRTALTSDDSGVGATGVQARMESEIQALRARVERLEVAAARMSATSPTRRMSVGRSSAAGVMYYVNEKDGETLAGSDHGGDAVKYFD
ncbi:hypothetical protein FB45DRAFT_906367 [Roridomyces roridus]|uniref:Mid2 domain-containing protein n=1 Tax=Roridomyces roridus TaxID=1738132 RepID=A0AAD7FPS9_9AGAR|nr:hypothetical protein FB45DRAFT_906367 [Roridomyces roridus]